MLKTVSKKRLFNSKYVSPCFVGVKMQGGRSPFRQTLRRVLVSRNSGAECGSIIRLRLLQTFAGAFPKKKKLYARCFLGNHHNLCIDKKVNKCRIG